MRRISRRQALTASGTVGLGALLAACSDGTTTTTTTTTTSTPGSAAPPSGSAQPSATLSDLFPDAASCELTPQQTEGPFYIDADAIRSDLREDRQGIRLRLAMKINDASCAPVQNAAVDIWHCDANGDYSGFERTPTEDATYLRGTQVTNADGIVEFTTIYPGWYSGRAVHIHFKVRLNDNEVLTSQLYFDETVSSAVYAKQPYSARTDRDWGNDGDNLYEESLVLTLREDGDGYLGLMSVNVKPA